jgi:hypothetical protein
LKEPGRFISARAHALKARPGVLDIINVHSLRSDETNVLTNSNTYQPHGTQAPQTPSLWQRTGNGLYPAPPSVEVLQPGRICRRQNARSLLPHCGLQRSPWRPRRMVYVQCERFVSRRRFHITLFEVTNTKFVCAATPRSGDLLVSTFPWFPACDSTSYHNMGTSLSLNMYTCSTCKCLQFASSVFYRRLRLVLRMSKSITL